MLDNIIKRAPALALIAAGVLGGCTTPAPTPPPAPDFGAMAEALAKDLCPEILACGAVQSLPAPAVIKVAPFDNNSRFFIDGNTFMSRLRLELNRYGYGRVSFVSETDKKKNIGKTIDSVRRRRQEDIVKGYLREIGERIAANPRFQTGEEVKIAVLPTLGENIINMNGDSYAQMCREEIANAASEKNPNILFLMPGATEGADYWLTGMFYPESMKKEGIINLNNYIDIIDERIRLGKPLDTASIMAEGASSYNSNEAATTGNTSFAIYEKERMLSQMLHDPSFRDIPDVNKRMNFMLVRPSDKVAVFEKAFVIDAKTEDFLNTVNYVMSGEMRSLSTRVEGNSSDYILVTIQLNDPGTGQIVYEGAQQMTVQYTTPLVYR